MGRVLAAAGLLALAAGCSDTSDPGRYIPPEDKARSALESALSAWQAGAEPGTIPGTANPTVQFVDSHRPPGRRLTGLTVLGKAPGDGPPVFTVKLAFDGSPGELKVRYVVVGIDPMWVIRHEDFDMLNHWDHPMKAGKAGESRNPAR
ncbi:MAG TPA: hypothetical protein VKD90_06560 [Gemmataceae bacterium]|nr:hypothetical protein [Gemmataceae bacterium]